MRQGPLACDLSSLSSLIQRPSVVRGLGGSPGINGIPLLDQGERARARRAGRKSVLVGDLCQRRRRGLRPRTLAMSLTTSSNARVCPHFLLHGHFRRFPSLPSKPQPFSAPPDRPSRLILNPHGSIPLFAAAATYFILTLLFFTWSRC
jgi:hypothetical protein